MRSSISSRELTTHESGYDHVLSVSREGTLSGTLEVSAAPISFERAGSDLIVTLSDGEVVLITDYFAFSYSQDIHFKGAVWSGEWIAKLANAKETLDTAQSAPAMTALGEPIGTVDKLEGVVTVVRANGQRLELRIGDSVFQGDMIETGADSGVGLILADNTVFSLGDNGTIILDEMIYDPAAEQGSSVFSLIDGAATFVSGQIAKIDPDAMVINTPVGTIGIRGTKAYIEVDGNNISAINLPEPSLDGPDGAGELIFVDKTGNVLGVINRSSEGLDYNSASGSGPRITLYSKQEADSRTGNATRTLPQTKIDKAIEAKEKVQDAKNKADELKQQIDDLDKKAEDLKEQADELEKQAENAESEEEQLALQAEAEALALQAEQAAQEKAALEGEAENILTELSSLEDQAAAAVEEAISSVGYKVNVPDTENLDGTISGSDGGDNNTGGTGDDDVKSGSDNSTDGSLNTTTTGGTSGSDIIVKKTVQIVKDEEEDSSSVEILNSFSGKAIDGYIVGGTVFVDGNGNGKHDSGEDSTTTNSSGQYTLETNQTGTILVTGGTDSDTGLAFTGILAVPQTSGSVTITPLTSLVYQQMNSLGITAAQAQANIKEVFGLTSYDINLFSFDPYSNLGGTNNAAAVAVMKAGVTVANAIALARAAFEGAGADGTKAVRAMYKAMADEFSYPEGQYSISSSSNLTTILNNAIGKYQELNGGTGSGLGASDISNAAAVIAASNDYAKSLSITGGDYTELTNTLRISQRDAVAALKDAVANEDYSLVNNYNTSAKFQSQAGNTGTSGDDSIVGSDSFDDVIDAMGGNDTLQGRGGSDKLYGGTGTDKAVFSGSVNGYDFTYVAASGNVAAHWEVEQGTAYGNDGLDQLFDIEYLQFSDVTLSMSPQTVSAGATMHGSLGNDSITGDSNANLIYGHNGKDTINGGAGNDILKGGKGNDSLFGGDGADTLIGGEGNDVINGGSDGSSDVVTYDSSISNYTKTKNADGSYTITDTYSADGDTGTDTISNVEFINFTDGKIIIGSDLAETQYGSTGIDTLDAGGGNDLLYGLDGDDKLLGGAGNDMLFGGNGNDRLDGGAGIDILIGEAGDDVLLFAHTGGDTYSGGAGDDTLYMSNTVAFDLGTSTDVFNSLEIVDATQSVFTFNNVTALQILNLTGDTNTLKITGGSNDTVNFATSDLWTMSNTYTDEVTGDSFTSYQSVPLSTEITVTVDVQQSINVSGLAILG